MFFLDFFLYRTYQVLLDARRRELQIKKWKLATKIKELIDGNIG